MTTDAKKLSAAELQAECLRALSVDPLTQGIQTVRIVRLCPRDALGQNWTFGSLEPAPTREGFGAAQDLLGPLHAKYSLED